MKEVEDLFKSQNEISNKIYEIAKKKGLVSSTLEPICDGIFNIEQYVKTPFRILWVLQEPYDDFDDQDIPKGGGWNLWEPMDKLIEDPYGINETWKRIAYYTFGMYNNIDNWYDIPNIYNNKDVVASLNKIAIINVSKMPGHKKSNLSSISKFYTIWKEIIDRQIINLHPNIIIYANTYQLINHSKGMNFIKEYWDIDHNVNYLNVYKNISNDSFHFSAYHPKATRSGGYGIKQYNYYNSLFLALKDITK